MEREYINGGKQDLIVSAKVFHINDNIFGISLFVDKHIKIAYG